MHSSVDALIIQGLPPSSDHGVCLRTQSVNNAIVNLLINTSNQFWKEGQCGQAMAKLNEAHPIAQTVSQDCVVLVENTKIPIELPACPTIVPRDCLWTRSIS